MASLARVIACPICMEPVSMPAVISVGGANRIYHAACTDALIASKAGTGDRPKSPFSAQFCDVPNFYTIIRSDETTLTPVVVPDITATSDLHFVFILDTSGSMQTSSKPSIEGAPSRWSLVAHILHSVVVALKRIKNRNVYITMSLFADRVMPTRATHTLVTNSALMDLALRDLLHAYIQMNTAMHLALHAAANATQYPNEETHHILLTDGIPDDSALVLGAIEEIAATHRQFTMHTIAMGNNTEIDLLYNIATKFNGIVLYISDMSTAPIMISSLLAHVIVNPPLLHPEHADQFGAILDKLIKDPKSAIRVPDYVTPEAMAIAEDCSDSPSPSAGQVLKAKQNYHSWGRTYLRTLQNHCANQFAADDISAYNRAIATPDVVAMRKLLFNAISDTVFTPHVMDRQRCDSQATQQSLSVSAVQAGCIHGDTPLCIRDPRRAADIHTTIHKLIEESATEGTIITPGVLCVVRLPAPQLPGDDQAFTYFWGPDDHTPVVTDWHPVSLTVIDPVGPSPKQEWHFPQNMPGWVRAPYPKQEFVYHLVIANRQNEPSLFLDQPEDYFDIGIASLDCNAGHRSTTDHILAHPYFQTFKVIEDITDQVDAFTTRVVTVDPARIARDPDTGLVSSWFK